jgi:hypothetical protein
MDWVQNMVGDLGDNWCNYSEKGITLNTAIHSLSIFIWTICMWTGYKILGIFWGQYNYIVHGIATKYTRHNTHI